MAQVRLFRFDDFGRRRRRVFAANASPRWREQRRDVHSVRCVLKSEKNERKRDERFGKLQIRTPFRPVFRGGLRSRRRHLLRKSV